MKVIARLVMDHYSHSNKCQPHATSFSRITVKGQLVEEALLHVVQAHLSKKHQMHVVPFFQDSTLSFSNEKATLEKATPYPLGK